MDSVSFPDFSNRLRLLVPVSAVVDTASKLTLLRDKWAEYGFTSRLDEYCKFQPHSRLFLSSQ
jgi:hypothetical protein